MKKRGRKKFTTNLTPFIESDAGVSFRPTRITREEMAYCMQETGVYNKTAILSMAIRNYYDTLSREAMIRSEMD